MKRKLLLSLAMAGCVAMTSSVFAANVKKTEKKDSTEYKMHKPEHKNAVNKIKAAVISGEAAQPNTAKVVLAHEEALTNPVVSVSGGANVDANFGGDEADALAMNDAALPQGVTGGRTANLNNAFVNVNAQQGDFSGRVGIATEPAYFEYPQTTHGLSADRVIVDQAFAKYAQHQNGQEDGVYASIGKQYLNFGGYTTEQGVEHPMIMPFTQALTNSNDIAALLGFKTQGFNVDGYVFQDARNSEATATDPNGTRRANFGLDLGYDNELGASNHLKATIGYLHDIGSTDLLSWNGAVSGPNDPGETRVGALALAATDTYTLTKDEVNGNTSVDGSVHLFRTLNAPSGVDNSTAYDAQVGYTMPLDQKPARIFVGYGGSADMKYVLPQHRISGGATYGVVNTDKFKANVGFELANDIQYTSISDTTGIKNYFFGVGRVGVMFG